MKNLFFLFFVVLVIALTTIMSSCNKKDDPTPNKILEKDTIPFSEPYKNVLAGDYLLQQIDSCKRVDYTKVWINSRMFYNGVVILKGKKSFVSIMATNDAVVFGVTSYVLPDTSTFFPILWRKDILTSSSGNPIERIGWVDTKNSISLF